MKSKTDYEKAQEFNAITRYLHSHRFNKTLEVLNKFSLSSKKQFNLVEIGCAHAKLYSKINNRFNYQYIGIEPCKESCDIANQRYNKQENFSIMQGYAEDKLNLIENIDIVIALETLEHIPENTVVRIIEKIAEKKPSIFICSVPIELGPIIWIKTLGSFIMRYKRNQDYTLKEIFWAGFGVKKLDKLQPHGTGHKGFNHYWLMQTIRHHFQITKTINFPFSWLPFGLSTSVFMLSSPRNKLDFHSRW
jgi:cyclopropane fatty-acyl-phospholipid synthase-like methyltransferase